MKKTNHYCCCGRPRQSRQLACKACWRLVPQELQRKVFRLFKTERGSDAHVSCVRECYQAIQTGRGVRAPTPPHLLCELPYGMPCLARKDVIGGTVQPCDNCAPHLEKTRKLLASHDLVKSGHAGVNQLGQIVDRRKQPDAVPMPENALLNIPKPQRAGVPALPSKS